MDTQQIKAINDAMSFIVMVSDPHHERPADLQAFIDSHVKHLMDAGVAQEVCDHFIGLMDLL